MFDRGMAYKKVSLSQGGSEETRKRDRSDIGGIIHPRPLERAFVFPRLLSNRGGNDICRPLGNFRLFRPRGSPSDILRKSPVIFPHVLPSELNRALTTFFDEF